MIFLNFKIYISREPVILQEHISSFGKNLSLIRTFIHGYCEVSNMKFNIWLDVSSEYIEDFCVIVSVAVGIFQINLLKDLVRSFSFGF